MTQVSGERPAFEGPGHTRRVESSPAAGSSRPSTGLSICVPNWNHKSYFGRSLTSAIAGARALERAGLGSEVLVIDDGSRDGSQKTLFTLALTQPDAGFDVVLAPENRGLAAARNLALRTARYRWVCMLDADNELIPENLPLFQRAGEETQAAIVYGNLIGHQDGVPVDLVSSDVPHDGLLELNYIDAFCVLDADRALELGGYTTSPYARAHEDWDLLLHAICEGERVVFVPAVMGRYFREPHSMIQSTSFEHSQMHRVYNQRGAGMPLAFTGPIAYLPSVGYIW